eukprot:TRINITY_DN8171_c0_g2_i1.p1 TRINITY_DN8171_c0_g2~~TRINITY_DN8171_c0_g2_i1.p1  ORF type:complete len:4648 (+),score=936.88 TRINITY_DN8171_c0_g2_i1:48-13991(+)
MEGSPCFDVGAGEGLDAARDSSDSPDAAATQLYLDDSLDLNLAELCGRRGVGEAEGAEDCPATQLYFEGFATHDEGADVAEAECPCDETKTPSDDKQGHNVGGVTSNVVGGAIESSNDATMHAEDTQLYHAPDTLTFPHTSGIENSRPISAYTETDTVALPSTNHMTSNDMSKNSAPQTSSTLATAPTEDTQLYDAPEAATHMPVPEQPVQQTNNAENLHVNAAQAKREVTFPLGTSCMASTNMSNIPVPQTLATLTTAHRSSNDASMNAEDTQFYDGPDAADHDVSIEPIQQSSGSVENFYFESAQVEAHAVSPPGTTYMICTDISVDAAPQNCSTLPTAKQSGDDAAIHAEETQRFDVPDTGTHLVQTQPVQQSSRTEHPKKSLAHAEVDILSFPPGTTHMNYTSISSSRSVLQIFPALATENPSSNDPAMRSEDIRLYDVPGASLHNAPIQPAQETSSAQMPTLDSTQAGADAVFPPVATHGNSTNRFNDPATQIFSHLATADQSSNDVAIHADDTQLYDEPVAAAHNVPMHPAQQTSSIGGSEFASVQAETNALLPLGTAHMNSADVSNSAAPQYFSTSVTANQSSNDAAMNAEDTQLYDVPGTTHHNVPIQPVQQTGDSDNLKLNSAQDGADAVSIPGTTHMNYLGIPSIQSSETLSSSARADQSSNDTAVHAEDTQLYDTPGDITEIVPAVQLISDIVENPKLDPTWVETCAIPPRGTTHMNSTDISNNAATRNFSTPATANQPNNDDALHAEGTQLHAVPDAATHIVPTVQQTSGTENPKINSAHVETDSVSFPGTTHISPRDISNTPEPQTFSTLATANQSSNDAVMNAGDTPLYEVTDASMHTPGPIQLDEQICIAESAKHQSAQAETDAASPQHMRHRTSSDPSSNQPPQTFSSLGAAPDTASHMSVTIQPVHHGDDGKKSKLDAAEAKADTATCPDAAHRGAGNDAVVVTNCANTESDRDGSFEVGSPRSTSSGDTVCYDEAEATAAVSAARRVKEDNMLHTPTPRRSCASPSNALEVGRHARSDSTETERYGARAETSPASDAEAAASRFSDMISPTQPIVQRRSLLAKSMESACAVRHEPTDAPAATATEPADVDHGMPCTQIYGHDAVDLARNAVNASSSALESEYGMECTQMYGDECGALQDPPSREPAPVAPSCCIETIIPAHPAECGMECTQMYGDECGDLQDPASREPAPVAPSCYTETIIPAHPAECRMECTQLYGDECGDLREAATREPAAVAPSCCIETIIPAHPAECGMECTQMYGDECAYLQDPASCEPAPVASPRCMKTVIPTQRANEPYLPASASKENSCTWHETTKGATTPEAADADHGMECTQMYGDDDQDLQAVPRSCALLPTASAVLAQASDHELESTQMYGADLWEQVDGRGTGICGLTPLESDPSSNTKYQQVAGGWLQTDAGKENARDLAPQNDEKQENSSENRVVFSNGAQQQVRDEGEIGLLAKEGYENEGEEAPQMNDRQESCAKAEMGDKIQTQRQVGYEGEISLQADAGNLMEHSPQNDGKQQDCAERMLGSTTQAQQQVRVEEEMGLQARSAEDNLQAKPDHSDDKQKDRVECELDKGRQAHHMFRDEVSIGLQAGVTNEIVGIQLLQKNGKQEAGEVKNANARNEAAMDLREEVTLSSDHEAGKEDKDTVRVDGARQTAANEVAEKSAKEKASDADGIGLQADALAKKSAQLAVGAAAHEEEQRQNICLPAETSKTTAEEDEREPSDMLASSEQETDLLHAPASHVSANNLAAPWNVGEWAADSTDMERASLTSPQKVTATVQACEEALMSTPAERCSKTRRSIGGGGQDAAASGARGNGSCSPRRSSVPDIAAAPAPASKRRSGPPRLSLLLPKRRRVSRTYGIDQTASHSPSGYDAASSALWGGRTPKKAAPPPSLQVYLAAKQEELDEAVTEVLAIPSIATPVRGDAQNSIVTSPIGSPTTAASPFLFGHGRGLLSVKREPEDSQRQHRGMRAHTISTKVEISSPRTRAQRLGLRANHPALPTSEPDILKNKQQLAPEPSEQISTERNKSAQRSRQRSESPPSPAWLKDACFTRRQLASDPVQSTRACKESQQQLDLAPAISNLIASTDNTIVSREQHEPQQRSQSPTPAWLKDACLASGRQQEQHSLDCRENSTQDLEIQQRRSSPAWLKDIALSANQSQASGENAWKHLNVAAPEPRNSEKRTMPVQVSAWWKDSCFEREKSQAAHEQSHLEVACKESPLQSNSLAGSFSVSSGRAGVIGGHDRQEPQQWQPPPAWLKDACLRVPEYHKIGQQAKLHGARSSEAGLQQREQQSINDAGTVACNLDTAGGLRSPSSGTTWLKGSALACNRSESCTEITSSDSDKLSNERPGFEDSTRFDILPPVLGNAGDTEDTNFMSARAESFSSYAHHRQQQHTQRSHISFNLADVCSEGSTCHKGDQVATSRPAWLQALETDSRQAGGRNASCVFGIQHDDHQAARKTVAGLQSPALLKDASFTVYQSQRSGQQMRPDEGEAYSLTGNSNFMASRLACEGSHEQQKLQQQSQPPIPAWLQDPCYAGHETNGSDQDAKLDRVPSSEATSRHHDLHRMEGESSVAQDVETTRTSQSLSVPAWLKDAAFASSAGLAGDETNKWDMGGSSKEHMALDKPEIGLQSHARSRDACFSGNWSQPTSEHLHQDSVVRATRHEPSLAARTSSQDDDTDSHEHKPPRQRPRSLAPSWSKDACFGSHAGNDADEGARLSWAPSSATAGRRHELQRFPCEESTGQDSSTDSAWLPDAVLVESERHTGASTSSEVSVCADGSQTLEKLKGGLESPAWLRDASFAVTRNQLGSEQAQPTRAGRKPIQQSSSAAGKNDFINGTCAAIDHGQQELEKPPHSATPPWLNGISFGGPVSSELGYQCARLDSMLSSGTACSLRELQGAAAKETVARDEANKQNSQSFAGPAWLRDIAFASKVAQADSETRRCSFGVLASKGHGAEKRDLALPSPPMSKDVRDSYEQQVPQDRSQSPCSSWSTDACIGNSNSYSVGQNAQLRRMPGSRGNGWQHDQQTSDDNEIAAGSAETTENIHSSNGPARLKDAAFAGNMSRVDAVHARCGSDLTIHERQNTQEPRRQSGSPVSLRGACFAGNVSQAHGKDARDCFGILAGEWQTPQETSEPSSFPVQMGHARFAGNTGQAAMGQSQPEIVGREAKLQRSILVTDSNSAVVAVGDERNLLGQDSKLEMMSGDMIAGAQHRGVNAPRSSAAASHFITGDHSRKADCEQPDNRSHSPSSMRNDCFGGSGSDAPVQSERLDAVSRDEPESMLDLRRRRNYGAAAQMCKAERRSRSPTGPTGLKDATFARMHNPGFGDSESHACDQDRRLDAVHMGGIDRFGCAWDATKPPVPASLLHEALASRPGDGNADRNRLELSYSATSSIRGRIDDKEYNRHLDPKRRSRSPNAAWLKDACYRGPEAYATGQGARLGGASCDLIIGRCGQSTHSEDDDQGAGLGAEKARAMSSQLLSAPAWMKDDAFVGDRCKDAFDSFSLDRVLRQKTHGVGSAGFITSRETSHEQQGPHPVPQLAFATWLQDPCLADRDRVDDHDAQGCDARKWPQAIDAFGGVSNKISSPDEVDTFNQASFNVRRALDFDVAAAKHDRVHTPCRRNSLKSANSEASMGEHDRVPTPCRRSSRRSVGSEVSMTTQVSSPPAARMSVGLQSSARPARNSKELLPMSAHAPTSIPEKPVGLLQTLGDHQGPYVRSPSGILAPQEAEEHAQSEATEEDEEEVGEMLGEPVACAEAVRRPCSLPTSKEPIYRALPMSQEPSMSQESELNVFAAPVDTQETQEFTVPKPEEMEQPEELHRASLSPGLTTVSMRHGNDAGVENPENAITSGPDGNDEVSQAHAIHAYMHQGMDVRQASPGIEAAEVVERRAAHMGDNAEQSNPNKDEAEETEDEATEDEDSDELAFETGKDRRVPGKDAPDDEQEEAQEEEGEEEDDGDEADVAMDSKPEFQQSGEQAGEEEKPTRANAPIRSNEVSATKPKRHRVKQKTVDSAVEAASDNCNFMHSEEVHAEESGTVMPEGHVHEMWGEPHVSPGSRASDSIEAAVRATNCIAAQSKVRTAAKSRPQPVAGQGKRHTATKSGPTSKHVAGKGNKRGSPGSAWQRPLPASLGGPTALDPVKDTPPVAVIEQFATAPSDKAEDYEDASAIPEAPPSLPSCMEGFLQDGLPRAAKPAAAERAAAHKAGAATSAAMEAKVAQSMDVVVPPQPIEDQVGAAFASDDDSDAPKASKKRRRATAPAKLAAPASSKSAVAAKKKPKPTAAKSSAKKKSTPCFAGAAGSSGAPAQEASLAIVAVGQAATAAEDCQPTKKRKGRTTKAQAAGRAAKGAKTSKDERPSISSAGAAAGSGPVDQDFALVPYATPELAIVPHGVVAEKTMIADSSYSSVVEAAIAAAAGRPVFATTGFELSSRQKRLLLELGCVLVADWCEHVTHLLADTFRRTTKMMCAICKGAYVLTPHFIKACREAGRLVGEASFVLRDEVCEAAFARKRGIAEGYSLAQALVKSRQQGALLKGVSVYCFASVADKRELPQVVAAAGGTWLSRLPAAPDDPSKLLLLAERAGQSTDREQQRRKALEVYDVELIREAACTQELRRSAYRLR